MRWYPVKLYCPRCGEWKENISHRGCRKKGHVWVNPAEGIQACDACGDSWDCEEGILYCSRGHVVPSEWADGVLAVEESDVVVADYGDHRCVLRADGTVVWVAVRSFPGVGY